MHFLSVRDGIVENVFVSTPTQNFCGEGMSSFVLGIFLTREMVT